MPRKGPAPRRDLMPDPLYRSVLVTQVVNKILTRGKRTLAERMTSAEIKAAMLDVAESYDRVARVTEETARKSK